MTSRVSLSVWAPSLGRDLRAIVPIARAAGFDGVQLDAIGQEPRLAGLSSTGRREVRRYLESQGLQFSSIRMDIGGGLGPAGDPDQVLDRVDQHLSVAAELACPVLCIDLGRLPPAPRIVKPKPKVTPQMAGLLILPDPKSSADSEPEEAYAPIKVDPALVSHWQQALGQLGEVADRYGTIVALSSTLSSFASLTTLIKQVNCPWFGIDLDTSAILRDDWTGNDFFDSVGSLVRHVRARDAIRGDDRRTKPAPIGRGDLQWRELLTQLDDAGYNGAITIDPGELPDPANSAVIGLKQLRSYLE